MKIADVYPVPCMPTIDFTPTESQRRLLRRMFYREMLIALQSAKYL